MSNQIISSTKSPRTIVWFFLSILALNVVILPVMAKDGVFRTLNVQTYSNSLGVNTVPTVVVIDNARHPGIYIVTEPSTELGRKMNLKAGMVLLTIDGYSVGTSKVADDWVQHRGNKPLNFTYALAEGGKPRILASTVSFGADNGVVTSPANAVRVPSAIRGAMVPQEEMIDYCLTLINQSRKSNGLEPVKQDYKLARLGQDYADYMSQHQKDYEVTTDRNPHVDLNGRSPEERARLDGASNFLNENIGRASRGDRSDKLVLSHLNDQMLASPGHRMIMLDPQARTVGIGISRLPNRFYLTEEFGQ